MSSILIILIKFYRLFVSPMIGPNCRFYPSCSGYAIEALHEHGTIKGIRLTMHRILKCHPFHLGGYDPVPREQKNCELRKTTDLE